ncbi:MAG: type II secretion system F family protein [Planctomycetaceae bacterium]|nr:type II secretion system F family protein [Planctomycetaceae bacterium]
MRGLFGKSLSGDLCETLLLISQAVKSNLPLADAIRLGLNERLNSPREVDRGLTRLAVMLEQGADPQKAIQEAGLPEQVTAIFEMALKNSNFADAFGELVRLESSQTAAVNRIIQALAYPIFMLGCMVSLFVFFLVFVVPRFDAVFQDFGLPLPMLTQYLVMSSELMRTDAAIYAAIAFCVYLYVFPKLIFPRFWYSIPLLGRIGRSLMTCRILGQMAFLLHQQVPLPMALEQCARTIRNRAYRRECLSAAENARSGKTLTEIVIRYYRLFPAWLAPMLARNPSGESISRSFFRASKTAEQQKESILMLIQSLVFPVLLIVFIMFVGLMISAMFMPLISLISELSAPKKW